MITRYSILIALCFVLTSCGSPSSGAFHSNNTAGYHTAKPISCVPYARDVSGIPLRGDAHTWWDQAAGRYERGHTPRKGAIFVLSKSSKLRYGHLSVVTNIVNNRTIEVTHSNWGSNKQERCMIYERMRVEDLSPANDWSRVRFWNYHIDSFGLPYPASGFIYPR